MHVVGGIWALCIQTNPNDDFGALSGTVWYRSDQSVVSRTPFVDKKEPKAALKVTCTTFFFKTQPILPLLRAMGAMPWGALW